MQVCHLHAECVPQMSKRSRSVSSFLGGDVNPQIITMTTGLATAQDDYVVNTVSLPIARIGGSKNKAVVMEILRIAWYLALVNANDPTATDWAFLSLNSNRADDDVSTLATMEEDVVDPLTFGMVGDHRGVATQGGNSRNLMITIDLSDGAGNGMLVAVDRIFIVGGNVAGAGPGSYTAKVTYRLKEVGIQEYVGIVQSQQG